MTLTEARDALDQFEPFNIVVADYPRLSRCLVTVRDGYMPDDERRVVNRALRELYRYCELTGQDWTNWRGETDD